MSNEEKQKRADYRKNRKKWMFIQLIIVSFITILLMITSIGYYQKGVTSYVNYNESSEVDYKVFLKDNDFYEDEYMGENQSYVASLINNIDAEFFYCLDMDAENITYEYSYNVDAQLSVIDKNSDVEIFNPVFSLVEKKTALQNSSNNLKLKEKVSVNYDEYNKIANDFVSTYNLDNTENILILKMHISVKSYCEDFDEVGENEYVVSLNIPLSQKTVYIEMSSSVPTNGNKILACQQGIDRNLLKVFSIILGIIDGLCIIGLVVYVMLTRNTDINYEIKVKRLVSNYKSYIQRIINRFDVSGYNVLVIDTFDEMLELRDTLQSPILMYENEDKTCTSFFIPTNSNILYLHEVKVDDYDKIYNKEEVLV